MSVLSAKALNLLIRQVVAEKGDHLPRATAYGPSASEMWTSIKVDGLKGHVHALMSTGNKAEQLAAIQLAGLLGDADTVDQFVTLLGRSDLSMEACHYVHHAMALIGGRQAYEALRAAAQDVNLDVYLRVSAIWALLTLCLFDTDEFLEEGRTLPIGPLRNLVLASIADPRFSPLFRGNLRRFVTEPDQKKE